MLKIILSAIVIRTGTAETRTQRELMKELKDNFLQCTAASKKIIGRWTADKERLADTERELVGVKEGLAAARGELDATRGELDATRRKLAVTKGELSRILHIKERMHLRRVKDQKVFENLIEEWQVAKEELAVERENTSRRNGQNLQAVKKELTVERAKVDTKVSKQSK